MYVKNYNKNILKLILLVLSISCDSKNESSSNTVIPTLLATGEDCIPEDINNNSIIFLSCSNNINALWSKKNGIEILPPAPKVYSLLNPNYELELVFEGMSDNNEILFIPQFPIQSDGGSSEELPQISYLFNGKEYIELSGRFTAISDNGKYIAGTRRTSDFYNEPVLMRDLEIVTLAELQRPIDVEINAVNNHGEMVGNASYEQVENSFYARYGVYLSEKESKFLPPPTRPDRNYAFAEDINSRGDIVLRIEYLIDDPNIPSNVRARDNGTLVLKQNGEILELSPYSIPFVGSVTSGINDNGVLFFQTYSGPSQEKIAISKVLEIDHNRQSLLVDKIVLSQRQELVDFWFPRKLNNKNETIFLVNVNNNYEYLLIKLL